VESVDDFRPAAVGDRSIMAVAERVLAAVDPGHEAAQAARLRMVGLSLFGSVAGRRRIARAVFDRPRRSVGGGFGTEHLELAGQILLLILNGVGTELLADVAKHRLDGAGGWLRRRRAARAISRAAAAQGASTPVPLQRPTDARNIGDLVTHLALRSGCGREQAQLLGTQVAAELSDPRPMRD
jgi:hypothetical protein